MSSSRTGALLSKQKKDKIANISVKSTEMIKVLRFSNRKGSRSSTSTSAQ